MKAIVLPVFMALIVAWCAVGLAADAKPMTNDDVVNMVRAKLPESTVVMAVRAAKPAFDTSADALIRLKTAGVPQAVIEAIIQAQTGGAPAAAAPSRQGAAAAGAAWNPEEVIILDDGGRTQMRYLTPQIRSAMRGLGFGGVAQYAVLRGTKAALRTRTRQPDFLLAVPENAQAESYYTVVSLAVRGNNTREILVGGGYLGYSSGVATDRIVPTASERLADQSGAPDGFVIYQVRTTRPLAPGEYAFVLYNSQIKTIGYFMSGLDSYFDFGVD